MPTASEMDQTIKELREAAAAINAAADRLARQSVGDDKRQNAETAADQQEKPKLSLADVRAVLADKSRAGYTDQVRELLHKYGASKLSAVDPKDYEALLYDAEALNEFRKTACGPFSVRLRPVDPLPAVRQARRGLRGQGKRLRPRGHLRTRTRRVQAPQGARPADRRPAREPRVL